MSFRKVRLLFFSFLFFFFSIKGIQARPFQRTYRKYKASRTVAHFQARGVDERCSYGENYVRNIIKRKRQLQFSFADLKRNLVQVQSFHVNKNKTEQIGKGSQKSSMLETCTTVHVTVSEATHERFILFSFSCFSFTSIS